MSTAELGTPLAYDEADLDAIMSPRRFVEVRKTPGGPAPEQTRALAASASALDADRAWWAGRTGALADAERQLAERAAAL